MSSKSDQAQEDSAGSLKRWANRPVTPYWRLPYRARFRRGLWVAPIVCIGVLVWALIDSSSAMADILWVALTVVWCGGLLTYNYLRMKSEDVKSEDVKSEDVKSRDDD